MDKKLHLTFTIAGDNVDKLDFYQILGDLFTAEDVKLTNMHVAIYYIPPEEKPKKKEK